MAGTGGLFALDAARAGTCRIGLSGPAWVDVAANGRAITSSARDHGPECSGLRKIVDFTLAPERHVVQLSGSPAPEIRLTAARCP